jgi:hypothetical protein
MRAAGAWTGKFEQPSLAIKTLLDGPRGAPLSWRIGRGLIIAVSIVLTGYVFCVPVLAEISGEWNRCAGKNTTGE